MADGLVDGVGIVTAVAHAAETLPVVGSGLGGLHGVDHGLQGLNGVLAGGGLSGEHDAAGAVKDRIGHVADLGTGRAGVADHRVQHLGGGDHVLSGRGGFGDHLLLNDRYLVGGDLHPQVAPGHHGPIGDREDLVKIVHTLPVFDLGNDTDVLTAPLIQLRSDIQHILSPADKGGRDKVKVMLGGKAQVGAVLFGKGRQLDLGVGNVDGLIVGKGTTRDHQAVDLLSLNRLYPQLHQAVVNKDAGAGGDLVVQVLIGDRDPGLISLPLPGGQGKALALGKGNGAIFERADADLGSLGVQQGGHRPAKLVPDPAQPLIRGQVTFVRAVGKVEPGAIHAGEDQLAEHLLTVYGGAQGTNDLGFSCIHKVKIPP